ncbi:hypothetical protein [Streptomyces sp. NPDC051162]|uniref:hypothetical protein n=1 Tax=Streptomyces sp. NPDC051162 TaxID=3154747 RepID=UPI003420FFA8
MNLPGWQAREDQSPPEQLDVTFSAAATLRTLGSAAGANSIAVLTAAVDATWHQGQQNRALWALAVVAVLAPDVSAPRRRMATG